MKVFDKNFKMDEPNVIHHQQQDDFVGHNESIEENTNLDEHRHEAIIKEVLDDVPSLDGNEVNLLMRQTNELTNLTNISDIIPNDAKIEHENDNALLDFLT
jgi:hypothetical protein